MLKFKARINVTNWLLVVLMCLELNVVGLCGKLNAMYPRTKVKKVETYFDTTFSLSLLPCSLSLSPLSLS